MGRHRTHRPDTSQKPMVEELRKAGYEVEVLSQVGNKFPDLIVAGPCYGPNANGFLEGQVLVEAKSKGGKLSDGQVEFMRRWPASLRIKAETSEEVLKWFGRI